MWESHTNLFSVIKFFFVVLCNRITETLAGRPSFMYQIITALIWKYGNIHLYHHFTAITPIYPISISFVIIIHIWCSVICLPRTRISVFIIIWRESEMTMQCLHWESLLRWEIFFVSFLGILLIITLPGIVLVEIVHRPYFESAIATK